MTTTVTLSTPGTSHIVPPPPKPSQSVLKLRLSLNSQVEKFTHAFGGLGVTSASGRVTQTILNKKITF